MTTMKEHAGEEEGEEEEEEMDVEVVQKKLMTMEQSELEQMLKEMELPKGGGKKEMVARLISRATISFLVRVMQAFQQEGDSEEEEEGEEEEGEEGEEGEKLPDGMAWAPPSVEAALKGKKRAAEDQAAREPAAKATKAEPKAAAKPAAAATKPAAAAAKKPAAPTAAANAPFVAGFIVGSGDWTRAPCLRAPCLRFVVLTQPGCTEVTKPEWWNDEGLKTMSARVLKAAPNEVVAINMRAVVLSGLSDAWEVGPRSAAELKEAAVHFERAAALCEAPAQKSGLAGNADWCHTQAATM